MTGATSVDFTDHVRGLRIAVHHLGRRNLAQRRMERVNVEPRRRSPQQAEAAGHSQLVFASSIAGLWFAGRAPRSDEDHDPADPHPLT